jgi:hypothetical protein
MRCPAIIVYGDLAKALKRESGQAVAYWWGVEQQTVWKWRKALGVVGVATRGTSRLRSDYTKEPWAVEARAAAHAKAADPERREKIAAAKRGKPRPLHVIEAIVQAHIGKPPSEETRRRMSGAHRARGTKPPAAGRPWEQEENALLGTMPDGREPDGANAGSRAVPPGCAGYRRVLPQEAAEAAGLTLKRHATSISTG